MAITPLPRPTPARAVSVACRELEAVAGSLWSGRGSGELVAGVEELQRLKAKTAALEAELLAELDVRDTAKRELGWGSTADWFTTDNPSSSHPPRPEDHHPPGPGTVHESNSADASKATPT